MWPCQGQHRRRRRNHHSQILSSFWVCCGRLGPLKNVRLNGPETGLGNVRRGLCEVGPIITSTRDHRHTHPALNRPILPHRFPEPGGDLSLIGSRNTGKREPYPPPSPYVAGSSPGHIERATWIQSLMRATFIQPSLNVYPCNIGESADRRPARARAPASSALREPWCGG